MTKKEVEKMGRGRKKGFKHSPETIEKMKGKRKKILMN